ncbi:type I-E CRISPR-associated protein Cse1/CasA [Streptomyces sp. NPDC093108]|uniref:type I-E CRISPR-associated protein Cse1/CasA n=1 Tax=Streptomyces sp. NPDC093108 TaxID=3366030 RepID=UPI00382AB732
MQLARQPAETAALVRLVLAVWASAARPADAGEWDAAWHAPALDTGRITSYLDAHADRFDLLGEAYPFWQSADVTEGSWDAEVLDCARGARRPRSSPRTSSSRAASRWTPPTPRSGW